MKRAKFAFARRLLGNARALRALTGVLLLLVLAGSGIGPTAHADTPQAMVPAAPGKGDPAANLLQVAASIVRVVPRTQEIWPGFSWPEGKAFLLYYPETAALLVSPHSPPAGFHPVEGPAVPPELLGRAYLYRGALPGVEIPPGQTWSDAHYVVGDRKILAVQLDPADPMRALDTLFRMAFYEYQQQRFAGHPDLSEVSDGGEFHLQEFVALAEVEQRILAEALTLPVPDLEASLHDYLTVRQVRAGFAPSNVTAVEEQLERMAGSIALVGQHAVGIASGAEPEQLADLIGRDLQSSFVSTAAPFLRSFIINIYANATLAGEPMDGEDRREELKDFVSTVFLGMFSGIRTQATGAAAGYLLDRLGADWRLKLEEGVTFEKLLREAVDFHFEATAPRLSDILERYRYEEMLAEAAGLDVDAILDTATDASRSGIQSLKDFYALAPVRLTWEIIGRPGEEFNVNYFSSGEEGESLPAIVQLEPRLIVYLDPQSLTATLPHRSLEVQGRHVLADFRRRDDERTLRFTVLLEDWPAINGGKPPVEGQRFDRILVEADGLHLTVEEPVWVEVHGQEVLITPAKPGTTPAHLTPEPPVVTFAALLPLTGDLSQSGQAARVGAELAVEEINEYLSAKGVGLRIGLTVFDTESDPSVALEKLKAVEREGFPPIVLGPDSSAEVAALREYANEHDILIISQGSTAPSLAVPGDNVFRMVPNDRLEAEALAILAREVEELSFRADVVIPMYRDDVFGQDLLAAFTEEFTRRGGLVEPGITYDPGTRNFAEPVRELSRAVGVALTAHPDARVAVYLISFDEAAAIFRLARRHELLSWVPWYGSNGITQSGALIEDEEAAAFAVRVNFISPTYVPDVDTLQSLPVQLAQIRARLGREPDYFAQVVRETLWLMTLAYLRTGLEQPDTAALRSAFLSLTGDQGDYRGSIGGTRAVLDDSGDILHGNSGFFGIEKGRDGYRWVRRAQLYRSPIHEPYWKFQFEPDPFEETAGRERIGEQERTVTIGALLPLPGAGPEDDARVGDIRLALEMARDDINQYLMNIGSPYRVDLRIEDTQGDPAVGLEGLARLAQEGISIVIGPVRSSMAAAVLDYANEQGVLLISPSITAPALAIPGDNLYRLVPDDSLQARASAELMAAERIRAVIPLYQDDVYGYGLVSELTKLVEAGGGAVLEGVRYDPGTQDFTAVIRDLGERAAEALDRYGAGAVAVYVTAFEEISAILEAAGTDPRLTAIRWYGSDAHALYQGLVTDANVGRVAAAVQLTSPAYRINPFDGLTEVFVKDYEVFMARMQKKLGRPAIDYAASAYTATWWAARAHFASGFSGDVEELRKALEAILMPETGIPLMFVTGDSRFNEAGDQTMGHYLFYRVVEENGSFRWKEYAVFRSDYEQRGIVYR